MGIFIRNFLTPIYSFIQIAKTTLLFDFSCAQNLHCEPEHRERAEKQIFILAVRFFGRVPRSHCCAEGVDHRYLVSSNVQFPEPDAPVLALDKTERMELRTDAQHDHCDD